jgi:hypothetical protein
MAKRSHGVRESLGSSPSIPTISRCENCKLPLVKRFGVTIIDAEGGETYLRNKLVKEEPGTIVVAVHDSCGGARKEVKRELKAAGRSTRIPRMTSSVTDVDALFNGKLYTMNDVKIVSKGQRVLMFMPRSSEY